jgi:NADPH:quinone reductase-like Zn-dependent oxidoreductase
MDAAPPAARDEGITMRYYHFPAFTGIDALQMDERDVPAPDGREILLRMQAWSLNYRDLLVSEGRYGRGQKPDVVPLSDGAGEIVAVGDEVTRWRMGDRVMPIFMPNWIAGPPHAQRIAGALGGPADGVLAEYVVVSESSVVSIPEHLSWAQAATLPCAAVTAWHAVVTHGRTAPGQLVLTLGTGGVSLFVLQFARLAGAAVIATSSSDAKLARLAELGASTLVNYLTTPSWGAEVHRVTAGGVDHTVDVGGSGTIAQSVAATRIGGRVSVVGVLTDGAGLDSTQLLMKGITMQGMFVGSRDVFEDMNAALARHRLEPLIDAEFPFTEAPNAYRHFASRSHVGKVVIVAD